MLNDQATVGWRGNCSSLSGFAFAFYGGGGESGVGDDDFQCLIGHWFRNISKCRWSLVNDMQFFLASLVYAVPSVHGSWLLLIGPRSLLVC